MGSSFSLNLRQRPFENCAPAISDQFNLVESIRNDYVSNECALLIEFKAFVNVNLQGFSSPPYRSCIGKTSRNTGAI